MRKLQSAVAAVAVSLGLVMPCVGGQVESAAAAAALEVSDFELIGPADQACLTSRTLQRQARAAKFKGGSEAAHAGLNNFNRRHRLTGNGRSCADCHMGSDSFQLSPANAKARFDALQACRTKRPHWDDPLFRAIDADDFRVHGDAASDFTNLTENGLIRVTIALPANMKLIDPATDAPSTETEADVWRSVPTVNNVTITGPDGLNPVWARGPNPTGGYQLDARKANLQDQALGALLGHAQVRHEPSPAFLDRIAAFEQTLFSSDGVRDLSDAMSAGTFPLPSADPPLDALEQQGKGVFGRSCAQCHGGPAGSTPEVLPVRYHDIFAGCPRPVDSASPARWSFAACSPTLARAVRTYEITQPDGTKVRRTSSDPGRALQTGFIGGSGPFDDWNKLDVPTVFGISHTAPYFHNNSAATLDDVLDHYTAFFDFVEVTSPPGVIPPVTSTDGVHFNRKFTAEERPALLAYLRKL